MFSRLTRSTGRPEWVRYGRVRAFLRDMPPWQGGGAMITALPLRRPLISPRRRGSRRARRTSLARSASTRRSTGSRVSSDALHAHESALVTEARTALRSVPGVSLFGPEDSAGIVSFALDGVHPHDIGTILDDAGVAVRAGHHCAQPLMDYLGVPATARASFAAHSDASDIEALVEGLYKVKRIFG